MKASTLRVFAVVPSVFFLLMQGCTAGSAPSITGPNGSQLPQPGMTILAPPYKPGMRLVPDSTRRINLAPRPIYNRIQDLADLRKLRNGTRHPANVLQVSNNGGQSGFNLAGADVQGSYAGQQVIPGFFLPSSDIIYAPTMRPGDPSCLEGSVVYDGVHDNYFVGFYAFCGSANVDGFYGMKPINDPAFQQYEVPYNGHIDVTMEVRYFASDEKWHGLLYNYTQHQWEDIFDAGGSCGPGPTYAREDAPGGCYLRGGTVGGGWDMFETHYYSTGAVCPRIPTIESDAVQLESPQGTWSLAPAIDYYNWGDCSSAAGTSWPYDLFSEGVNSISGDAWSIRTGGTPPPIPRPTVPPGWPHL